MNVERVYNVALRLYPYDYRARFGAEMLASFRTIVRGGRAQGLAVFIACVVREAAGLAAAIAREWALKWTTDPVSRARVLPDCRRMRPVGVTRAEWAAGLYDGD